MKKLITFICISFICVLSISAQGRKGKEKIKALKISYLTEQLALTSDEAQKFWPIYNNYDNEQHCLRDDFKEKIKKALKTIESISEKDAEELTNAKLAIDKQLYDSKKTFIKKIKEVISYKKILQLQVAEMEFGRKLMSRYRHKKGNSKN
jgi:Skp family chaperone for outer membrane proteins